VPTAAPLSPGIQVCLFDFAQAVLAEEHLRADKEGGGRTKGAARHRLPGIAQQALFDGGILDSKNAPTTFTALRLAASPARRQNESKPELLIGLLVWLSLAC
jgi:hypothetical protein